MVVMAKQYVNILLQVATLNKVWNMIVFVDYKIRVFLAISERIYYLIYFLWGFSDSNNFNSKIKKVDFSFELRHRMSGVKVTITCNRIRIEINSISIRFNILGGRENVKYSTVFFSSITLREGQTQ